MIEHVRKLQAAVAASGPAMDVAQRWGRELAEVLPAGGRLLVAGNGGSAAEAQHLAAELVGRYRPDRPPFSAIALNTDTSALTAIANDYGADEIFARQVCAHGRWGDVCLLMSTSGRSPNLLDRGTDRRQLRAAGVGDDRTHAEPVGRAGPRDAVGRRRRDLHHPGGAAHRAARRLRGVRHRARLRRRAAAHRLGRGDVVIVVLGDSLLDVDVEAAAGRFVPDTVAPVLDEVGRRERPGGAALTALLAAVRTTSS